MIEETLNNLGLNKKESQVYLEVLKRGRATPGGVAAITKINRTTVYSVAKELIKKGFISEDLAGITTLVATNPNDLKFLIHKEEKVLENRKTIINEAIEELQKLSYNAQYQVPKITFVQENDLENYLHKRSNEWHESIMSRDGVLWGFQDHTFAEHYEKWIDWEWQTGGPKGLQLKILSNKSDIERRNTQKQYKSRMIKFWGKGKFTASVWVHGDYVIMAYTKSTPHYLIEIHDVTLAHNMRELFRGIWEEIT